MCASRRQCRQMRRMSRAGFGERRALALGLGQGQGQGQDGQSADDVDEERQSQEDRGQQAAGYRRDRRPDPAEQRAPPLVALVLALPAQLFQAVEDQGGVAARAHADAHGEEEFGQDEGREAPSRGVDGQAQREEERAEDQRPLAADDVGQVARGDFEQQDRQVEEGLDGEDLGGIQAVGGVVQDQDRSDGQEIAQEPEGEDLTEIAVDPPGLGIRERVHAPAPIPSPRR